MTIKQTIDGMPKRYRVSIGEWGVSRRESVYLCSDIDQINEGFCKPVTQTDCRTDVGVTVGLIDSIITTARVLSGRILDSVEVQEALRDFRADEDVRALLVVPDKPVTTTKTVATIIRDICEHEPDDNPDSVHISVKALELILMQNLEGLHALLDAPADGDASGDHQ
ncbi:hypothetical protein [Pseudomonas sp. MIACH]|uniref:hypothetical protein n=1 Tax=Pseudomonas sp. MIACH TaxID=1078355 RepID=UPI00069D6AB5|nr:hypothetical protein [Pseudomonas sp. MIACH]